MGCWAERVRCGAGAEPARGPGAALPGRARSLRTARSALPGPGPARRPRPRRRPQPRAALCPGPPRLTALGAAAAAAGSDGPGPSCGRRAGLGRRRSPSAGRAAAAPGRSEGPAAEGPLLGTGARTALRSGARAQQSPARPGIDGWMDRSGSAPSHCAGSDQTPSKAGTRSWIVLAVLIQVTE